MATKVRLDLDDITLGDLEIFEEVVGGDLMEALKPVVVRDENGKAVPDPNDEKGRPLTQVKVSSKTMLGLVYVALHKDNPDLTIDDVRRMSLKDLDFDLEGAEGVDPQDSPPPSEPVSEPAHTD